MPDIASIGAAISSVKTATEIAKLIKNSELTLADAEIKLKIADLIGALADAKMEIAEIQDVLREKDLKIKDLEALLQNKESLTFDGKLYRKDGDQVPYCPVCYERDSKLHHLTFRPGGTNQRAYHLCKVCKATF